jgi:hypothetical protein
VHSGCHSSTTWSRCSISTFADENIWSDPQGDQSFFDALQELTAYAIDEARRLEQAKGGRGSPGGILAEMQELLGKYRHAVSSISEKEYGDEECHSPTNQALNRLESQTRYQILRYGQFLSHLLRANQSEKDP